MASVVDSPKTNESVHISAQAKLAATCLMTALSVLIFILRATPGSTDYEASPLLALGPIFPILLVCGTGSSYGLTLYFGVSRRGRGRDWILIYACAVAFNATIAAIPFFRGYYLYDRDDTLTHIGFVLDIDRGGAIPGNVYPLTHLLMWSYHKVTGIPIQSIFLTFPTFFTIMISTWMLASAKLLVNDPKLQSIIAGCSLPLMRFDIVAPYVLATYLLLILITLSVQRIPGNKSGSVAVLAILAFLLPFWHPIITVVAVVGLVLLEIPKAAERLRRFRGRPPGQIASRLSDAVPGFSFLSLVTTTSFLLWLWNNTFFWEYNISSFAAWIVGGEQAGPSRTQQIFSVIETYGLSPLQIGISVYGIYFMALVLEVLAILFVLFRRRRIDDIPWDRQVSIWMVPFLTLGVASLVVPTLGFDPTRLLVASYVGIPLFAFLAHRLRGDSKNMKRGSHRLVKVAVFLLGLFVVFAGGLSSLSVHQSEYSQLPGRQVTLQELVGTEWLLAGVPDPSTIKEVNSRHFRLAQAVFGVSGSLERGITQFYFTPDLQVPPHFGYDKKTWASDSVNPGSFIIISTYDVDFNLKVYSGVGRFTRGDFVRLQNDPTVSWIYTSGGYAVVYVAGRP